MGINKNNMNMKQVKIYFLIAFTAIFSSCLTAGLDELPVYTDAEITNFKFEYRWAVKEGSSDALRVKPLSVKLDIDKEKHEIICNITVPPADASFTEEIRSKVELNNIIGYASISTASTIKPLGNSPKLGKFGDYGQSDISYEVIAADNKTKKTWKLIIKSFIK